MYKGVSIYGAVNLPSTLPIDASQMYAKNIVNLWKEIYREGKLDFESEITRGACITHDGNILNTAVAEALK